MTAHAAGGETAALTPVPGQTVRGKGQTDALCRAENCRFAARSVLMGRGQVADSPTVRAENCRSDASSELMRAGEGRRFTHRVKPENCRPDIASGQALYGRRAFYAGAVVPLSWGFML